MSDKSKVEEGPGGNRSPGFQRQYSDETVELAYQVWASTGRQIVTETVRNLETDHGVKVPRTTVSMWRDRDEWPTRYQSESVNAGAVSQADYVRRLQVAAPAVTQYLIDVSLGHCPPDRERISAARHIETAARQLLIEQSRQQGKRSTVDSPAEPTGSLTRGKTVEELLALETERRKERESGN